MKVTELYKIVVDDSSDAITSSEIISSSESYSGVYYWNNSDVDIVYDGETYTPEVVSRSDMVQNNEINRQDIELRVEPSNPIAQLYYHNPPEVVVTVTIFRKENDCFLTYWKGRIVATKSTDWECIIQCESVFTSMRRTGARARYQVQCRHALYGTACGVDKSLYAVAGTVSSVNGTSIGVSSAGGDFIGGMIEFNGIFRFIVGQTGTTIRLWRSMPGLEVSDSVTLYPGCNRTLTQCHERFNNAENHGGFPWLPYSNPFQNVNIF